MRNVYYVSSADCTDGEPRPGWYVGTDDSEDLEGDGISGPYGSKAEALEMRDVINDSWEDLRGSKCG